MAIPDINIPSVIPANSSQMLFDPGSVAKAYGSVGELGSAISGASDAVFAIKQRRDKARDAAFNVEVESTMNRSWDMFMNDIETDPNEDKWESLFEKRISPVRDGIDSNSSVSRNGKNAAYVTFDNFYKDKQIEVNHLITKKQITGFRATFKEGIEEDLRIGNLDGVLDKLGKAKENGIFEDEEIVTMKMNAETRIDDYAAMSLIEESPFEAETAIMEADENGVFKNFDALPPDRRRALHRFASKARLQAQRDIYDDMLVSAQEGRAMPKDIVIQHMKDGKISTSSGKAYIKEYHGEGTKVLDIAKYASLMSRIDRYDTNNDIDRAQWTKLLGETLKFPQEQSGFLKERLEKKLDRKSTLNNPAYKGVVKFLDGFFERDAGLTLETDEAKKMRLAQDAEKRYAVMDALDQFLLGHPTATREEMFSVVKKELDAEVFDDEDVDYYDLFE
jgi:hypothetical protein